MGRFGGRHRDGGPELDAWVPLLTLWIVGRRERRSRRSVGHKTSPKRITSPLADLLQNDGDCQRGGALSRSRTWRPGSALLPIASFQSHGQSDQRGGDWIELV